MLSGAAAFAAMWRAIPLLRPLGLAARSPASWRCSSAAIGVSSRSGRVCNVGRAPKHSYPCKGRNKYAYRPGGSQLRSSPSNRSI